MTQKMIMMGLVMTPNPKPPAVPVISVTLSTPLRSSMICCPTVPILVPKPVSPEAKVPCRVTDRE